MPCGHKLNGRNLIVCIDGTSNQFGKKNTNVIELYNLILKKDEYNQRTWYNSGIGTYARPSWKSPKHYKQVLYHKIDLAIAWDFERTVLGAYRWLSDNYEKDDCIFLFGFSRGAFQVRVLSAMIEKVGLVYRGNEMQIPFAYELYADPESGERLASDVGDTGGQEKSTMAARFKKAFSYEDVRVHFVGAWDTVSSIGIARGKSMLPGTVNGMKHVCYFRHALALDERRVKSLPEYAYGGSATVPAAESAAESATELATEPLKPIANTRESKGILPQTKEVWFAGTHSDIGGGNVENPAMDRARPPLRWMVFEAGAAGLRTARFERELLAYEQINIIESLTWPWLFFEICPFKRLTFTRKANGLPETTQMPHLGSGRKIHRGQKIHASLVRATGPTTHASLVRAAGPTAYTSLKRKIHTFLVRDSVYNFTPLIPIPAMSSSSSGNHRREYIVVRAAESTAHNYTPKARPFGDDRSFWESLRDKKKELADEWLELDLYEDSKLAVEKLVAEGDDTALKSLLQAYISGDAREAVYTNVIEALRMGRTLENKNLLLRTTMQLLKRSSGDDFDFKLSPSREIRPLLSDLFCDDKDYLRTARDFMLCFTNLVIKVVQLKKHHIRSLAFSRDGHIVSGSQDGIVQFWDAVTGNPVGQPLEGHRGSVLSVAFSPDGKHAVSGSIEAVRIWDVKTGRPVGEPLRSHRDWVWCVAFSPDVTRIVSGSGDTTIRIWDAKTGIPVGQPLKGHSGAVGSVAFSADGKYIVSGSDDRTVRIWDAKTGTPVGRPLEGHGDAVKSVVFSADGKYIASGSWDRTVRIWNAETGSPVGEPLEEGWHRPNLGYRNADLSRKS